jgi:isoleucyl-tRNA synthetase/very-short-patch-repair endonuclease
MNRKNSDKKNQYPEFDSLHLPTIEKEILKWWEENKVFEQSVNTRPEDKRFVFYEGPPSANGKPGIHHVMSRTIKDLFCRFKTLQGYRVERKAGWDTHGLPVELGVEKQIGITKADIGTKITVAEYNKLCREDVMKFTDIWNDLTRKMGYWVDMENPYITYENYYIESLWALLKKLYDKNLLYEGYTIQPYSPAAGTGLSSHELNQPGCYREVKDVSAIAMFKVIRDEKSKFLFDNENEDVRFLAWTTTPWTLPSNTALAVGKDIEYVVAKTINKFTGKQAKVILAKDRILSYFNAGVIEFGDGTGYGGGLGSGAGFGDGNGFGGGGTDKNKNELLENSVEVFKGSNLEGIRYEQLLPYTQPQDGDAFRVVLGDFVTTTDGTGIVHIAPSFGSDDFKVAKQNGIGSLTLVDRQGKFTDEVNDPVFPLQGRYVKEAYLTDAEKEQEFKLQHEILHVNNIIADLKSYMSVDDLIVLKLKLENKLFKTEKYEHNYPHCWRTDKPVIYYPLDSWFIRTTAVKDRLIELNKTINWKPAHTGEGRFGQWLENLVDWNLSRSRYWGTPLPIWMTEDEGETKCIGSIAELKSEIEKSAKAGLMQNVEVNDLHKPFVDGITLVSDSGKPMKRVSDLIDVWFDSGAMPYAQWHWLPSPLTPEGGTATHDAEQELILKWKTANPTTYEKLKEFSKQNRNNPTQAEEILWTQLSGKKLHNYKFRRQHIIGDSIVDFVCIEKKLVIEVDGSYHNTAEQQEADKARTQYLSFLNYKVIRFANEEVIGNTDAVLNSIWKELAARPTLEKGLAVKAPFGGLGAAFPADFIAEGVDQTRGWFFTLHVLGVALFDSVAYKNVVSNGLLLDKNGNKMSKRLGNIIDPFETLEKYSADATRWYMMRNSDPWENMKFDMNGLQDVIRSHFGTLYNTYGFFALYANIDRPQTPEGGLKDNPNYVELDRWILSRLQTLVKEATAFYEDYEPTKVARAIEKFVDEDLSNWYVRLNRRRFWKGEMSDDKQAAYDTLYHCLNTVSILMSPIAPFFSEWLYRNLRSGSPNGGQGAGVDSVHVSHLVKADEKLIDKDLEERMELAQKVCSLALSIRKSNKIKVRQPLKSLLVNAKWLDAELMNLVADNPSSEEWLRIKELIKAEVNVKDVIPERGFVTKPIPNYRSLRRFGNKTQLIGERLKSMSVDEVQMLQSELEFNGTITIAINETVEDTVELIKEDVDFAAEQIEGFATVAKDGVTVALDITITEDLRLEGNAREFVNKVQNLRKDKDFQVLDRIKVSVVKNPMLESTLAQFKDYIANEILAKEILLVDSLSEFDEVELNEEILKVKVELN